MLGQPNVSQSTSQRELMEQTSTSQKNEVNINNNKYNLEYLKEFNKNVKISEWQFLMYENLNNYKI